MMNSQLEILLSNINYSEQDIDVLLEAANNILTATETDFKHIQGKKWYNRLWEIITFSKDGQKVTAKNIASLSKMQDVIIKALLMVSKDQRKAYDFLTKNSNQLLSVVKSQSKLSAVLKKLIYEHEPRPDIQNICDEYQYVIVSTARKFADSACRDEIDSLAREYLNNLQKSCGHSLNPDTDDFDYGKIDQLDKQSHQILAIILCEVECLIKDNQENSLSLMTLKPKTSNPHQSPHANHIP